MGVEEMRCPPEKPSILHYSVNLWEGLVVMDDSLLLHCYLLEYSIKRRNVLTVRKWDSVKDRKCVKEKGEGNK